MFLLYCSSCSSCSFCIVDLAVAVLVVLLVIVPDLILLLTFVFALGWLWSVP